MKEGTSVSLLQSGLDEKLWADSMECLLPYAKCSRPPGKMGEHLMKDVEENHSEGQ